jgi:hypothetical protein
MNSHWCVAWVTIYGTISAVAASAVKNKYNYFEKAVFAKYTYVNSPRIVFHVT